MKRRPAPYAPLFPYLELTRGAVLAPGELVIDNFAGLGGASTGLEQALGRPVDVAINHSRQAVELHAINHPYTRHYVEDVWQVDPLEVTGGQPVALCWFSPTCTHFSKAKGAGLLDRKIRGLAWVTLRWADLVKPRVIILENVEEFQTWGPLTEDGRPDKQQSGRTFNSFLNALRYQGYQVEWKELRASEFGAPTIRKRLFLVARRDGLPIVWPQQTHAAPTDVRVKAGTLKPFRTAAECIDWELPTPSIFTRKKALVPATMKRIARGIERFVLDAAEPFIVTCNHGGEAFRGQGLDRPFLTVTAANEAHGLIVPALLNKQHQAPARAATDPLSTITTNHNKNELAAAQLVTYYGPKRDGEVRGLLPSEPLKTQGTENRFALLTASLVKHYGGTYQGAGVSMTSPADTVTSVDHHALLTGHLTAYYGQNGTGDMGQRADEPARTIPTVDRFGPVCATLMRQFGTSTAADVAAPLGTIVSGGNGKTHLIAAECQCDLSAEQLVRAREVYTLLAEYIPQALERHADHAQQLVLVQVRGEWYVLADIGMRMLTPRELARCQGFPESFKLDATLDGRPLSKAAQVRGIGNSVCPDLARVVALAQMTALPEQQAAD